MNIQDRQPPIARKVLGPKEAAEALFAKRAAPVTIPRILEDAPKSVIVEVRRSRSTAARTSAAAKTIDHAVAAAVASAAGGEGGGGRIPPLADIIFDGINTVTPELAQRLLTEGYLTAQDDRHKSSTAKLHIMKYASMMLSGEYRPTVAIYVAVMDGQIFLLDGYHRVSGVVEADRPVKMRIVVVPCENMDEVNLAYATYNRNDRSRSLKQIRAAYDVFPPDTTVTKTLQTAFYKTVPFILAGFKNDGSKMLRPEHKTDQFQFTQANEWVEACTQYGDILTLRPGRGISRRFMHPSIIGVAMISLRYRPSEANTFWGGVVNPRGLSETDGAFALNYALLTRSDSTMSTARGLAVVAERAWARWLKGESVEILRAHEKDINGGFRVAGTPYRPIIE